MRIKARTAARRLAFFGALTMLIGLGAASAASATTKVPIWTQGGTHVPFGTEVSFSAQAVSGMDLSWKAAGGLPINIQCETLSASGKIEDPASLKAGTLKATAAQFEGCRVLEVGEQTAWKGTTCSVPSNIPLEVTSGTLTNTPYAAGGLQLPSISMRLWIKNCPGGFYENTEWHFSGSPTGNEGHGAWPGEVLFPPGTALSVNSGGYEAKIEFGMNFEAGGTKHYAIAEEEKESSELPAPGPHWYRGGGMRGGEGPRTLISAGSPMSIKGSGDSFTIQGILSGVGTKISCSGGSTTGSVENPVGGKSGTVAVTYGFTGCSVIEPAGRGCIVEGGAISLEPLTGLLTEPWASLRLSSPPPNESLSVISVSGCKENSPPTNKYPFKGPLKLTQSALGTWLIPRVQNENTLRFGGQVATAYGSVAAESSAGEVISWAE
jgi:hypothetical protein